MYHLKVVIEDANGHVLDYAPLVQSDDGNRVFVLMLRFAQSINKILALIA